MSAGLDEARSDDAVHPGSLDLLCIWGGPLQGDNIAQRLTLEKCQYVVLDKVLYRIDNLRKNRLVCRTLFTQGSVLHAN